MAKKTESIEDFLKLKCKRELNLVGELYPKKRNVLIDFRNLEEYSPTIAEELITNPDETIGEFDKALGQINIAFSTITKEKPIIKARITGLPAEYAIMVRDCTSDYVGSFFTVQGLVTKVADVLPKVWKGVFKCKRCQRESEVIQEKRTLTIPAVCDGCGRRDFELVPKKSKFIDFQKVEIQEPLEVMHGGEQAKRISVWLENDLTNRVLPGQKINVCGILKLEAPKGGGTVYMKFIEANSVEQSEQIFEEMEISPEDEKEIKELAKNPKIYEMIIKSVAPSIYGHNEAKEAIALQLFGGASDKVLPDGMKIRSNIHVLLIGDPGTAKSQILKYVDKMAPKSIYASGKSTTGGGLTAIAEKDEFAEGGWVLKAGALVLSSGGLACIDEFDKMSPEDRSSIHEALEQQTVSVAKAGIIATFKAESAVLAAANPKYSRFDPYKTPAEQFDIPPTILSRFDLIFPIKDVLDEQRDRELASHMLRAHRLSQTDLKKKVDDDIEATREQLKPPIEEDLLRKYVAYTRKKIRPVLDKEAMGRLNDYYVNLRRRSSEGSVTLTPRQLEALVRLAEASAKIRLSRQVEVQDAERAIRLVEFVLTEIGMDKESGTFDIDRLVAEHPKSERDKIHVISGIVEGLEAEYDLVPIERVVEDAKNFHNIDERTSEKLIHELINKGDFYEPRHGTVKKVSR